jgi:hypothetical protein
MNKKNLVIISIIVVIVLLVLSLHSYDGLNKGVYIDILNNSIGFEIVGTPGFFVGNY